MKRDIILASDHVVLPAGVPRSVEDTIAMEARGQAQMMELSRLLGGHRAMPRDPIMLYNADTNTVILLDGGGLTEADELQDMALEVVDDQNERIKRYGRGLPYDDLREKHGHVRADDAAQAIQDALQERIRHHQQNPVTDPFREPRRALGNPQFSLGAIEKEASE